MASTSERMTPPMETEQLERRGEQYVQNKLNPPAKGKNYDLAPTPPNEPSNGVQGMVDNNGLKNDIGQVNEKLAATNSAKEEAPAAAGTAPATALDTKGAPENGKELAKDQLDQANQADQTESKPTTNEKQKPASASKGKEVDPELLKKKKDEEVQEIKRAPEPDFVGWKQVGGWEERDKLTTDEEAEDLLQRSTLLETYVNEKYYGDWYHNTALIIVSSFFSWLVARFGGGLAWLAIVLAFTATAYRTSVRRLRRNTRDDVARELGMKKLETDTETLEWMNAFLVKFWLIYEPVLSGTIVQTVNQVLVGAVPGFIESLSLDTFTLGTKPPRVEHVRTFPKTDEDVAVMDWKFSFTPNDTDDMTAKQLKNKVNPKVVLGVRIGKGFVSKSLPILVEDMSFSGLMRVRIKMMTSFPHVQTVDVSFLQPPEFDFVLKPIGGETFGFDINIIPGLQGFINEMVHSNMGPMMYAPNTFQLNIEQMLAGAGDSSIGVLAVTIHHAKGLKGSDSLGNTVDPYVKFSFNEREELARSEIKDDTKNPTWNETKYLMVGNLNDVLTLEVVDFNDYRKDKKVGTVNFSLETLAEKPDQETISASVMNAGKNRGVMIFSVHWYPALEGKTLEDGTVQPPPESNTGIVKFTVHQAKDLDVKQSMVGQLSPYADLLLNDRLLLQTKHLKRTNSPIWDESYEFLVTNKQKCKLGVRIKDSRGLAQDPVLGSYKLPLQKMLDSIKDGQDWFKLTPMGRVRMSATFKPVAIKDAGGLGGFVEPIGVLRFHFKRGAQLPKLDSYAKIDPYMRIFVGGIQRARTDELKDTPEPEWDEIVYATVENANQRCTIEAMDQEKLGKDRTLGWKVLDIKSLITRGEDGKYLKSQEVEQVANIARQNKEAQGKITYTIQFLPSIPVMDPEEAAEKREEARKAAEEREAAIARGEDPDAEQKKLEEEQAAAAKKAEEEAEEEEEEEDSDAETLNESEDEEELEMEEPEKVDIPLEELIQYQSGILAFSVSAVENAEADTYLRAVIDKADFPCWISPKLKSSRAKIGETGEAMIRELEWSEIAFQLVSKELAPSEDAIVQATIPTLKLLKDSFGAEKTITLSGGGRNVRVKVSCRYFPVEMTLLPRESVNNQGTLRVDVMDASDLIAADRSGKSDPYAVFHYNDVKLFKSQVQKKTLTPAWNECFEAEIVNREKDNLVVSIYDWDMGPGADDFLGKATIPINELEPLNAEILILPLGEKAGQIRLKLNFKPQYVAKKVKSSDFGTTFVGTMGTPGKVLTEVGSAPVKVVGGVASGVYGGVTKGGSFLTSHIPGMRHKDKNDSVAAPDSSLQNDGGSIRSASIRGNHKRMNSISSEASPDGETAPGQCTIMQVSGFEGVQHLQVRVYLSGKKEKELFKTKPVKSTGQETKIEENVAFKAPKTAELIFRVRDHKSLGRDEEIGEGRLTLGEGAGDQHTVNIAGKGDILVYINYSS